tara:strand:+ start:29 stop:688 length:660 start_codon:yes stop_codon:yes gene_type:complete
MIKKKINAMLFDFDGTLADTSLDMVNCLNILLKKKSIKPVNLNFAKNFISTGAGGLIDCTCPKLSKDERSLYIKEYLSIYKENLFINTHLFDGISQIIDLLVFKNYKWGIVTNKPGFLVNPIIELLNFKNPPDCIVAGDTLKVKKPNPQPLIYASKQISCDPSVCAYIGDDARDIKAANAANMVSIAASYGFINDKSQIKEWGSDHIINSPLELKNLIN